MDARRRTFLTVLGLIISVVVSTGINAQPLPGRPVLVVVDDQRAPTTVVRLATAYTYDSDGNVLTLVETESTVGVMITGPIRSGAYTYDDNGRLTSEIEEFHAFNAGLLTRFTTERSYDAEGRPSGVFRLEQYFSDSFVVAHFTLFGYDSDDHLVQEVVASDFGADWSIDSIKRTIYTYESGLLGTKITGSYTPDTEFRFEEGTAYGYDDQQRVVRQSQYVYSTDTDRIEALTETYISYDGQGHPHDEATLLVDVPLNHVIYAWRTTRTYAASGDLIEERIVTDLQPEIPWAPDLLQVETLTYDSERRLITKVSTFDDPALGWHKTYTYFY